jgi:hypothetical protein
MGIDPNFVDILYNALQMNRGREALNNQDIVFQDLGLPKPLPFKLLAYAAG